jgi:hypothetical protein
MTTLTFKINKSTKAGKAFMAMAETFFKDVEGIEIIETPDRLPKSSSANPTLLQQIEIGLHEVNEIKNSRAKRKTLTELMNEK